MLPNYFYSTNSQFDFDIEKIKKFFDFNIVSEAEHPLKMISGYGTGNVKTDKNFQWIYQHHFPGSDYADEALGPRV